MPSCKHTDYLRIRSFSDAKIAFEDTAPIRGKDKDYDGVPLERSRRAHNTKYLVRRINADGTVSFRLYLYSTPVVSYHEDGRVVLDLSYPSVSTAGFAYELTPPGISVALERGDMVVRCRGTGSFIANDTITLRQDDKGNYAPVNVPQRFYDKLNLSRAAQTRKRIRPLLDYLHTIKAMCPISGDAYAAMRDSARPAFDMENTDHFPAIAASLMRRYSYKLEYAMPSDWRSLILNLAYKQYGAYDKTPVPYGSVRHDSYITKG